MFVAMYGIDLTMRLEEISSMMVPGLWYNQAYYRTVRTHCKVSEILGNSVAVFPNFLFGTVSV